LSSVSSKSVRLMTQITSCIVNSPLSVYWDTSDVLPPARTEYAGHPDPYSYYKSTTIHPVRISGRQMPTAGSR
jgi:hypothetical protein